jgi:hypothetical protein
MLTSFGGSRRGKEVLPLVGAASDQDHEAEGRCTVGRNRQQDPPTISISCSPHMSDVPVRLRQEGCPSVPDKSTTSLSLAPTLL